MQDGPVVAVTRRGVTLGLAATVATLAVTPDLMRGGGGGAWAATEAEAATARAERWAELKGAVFGDRPVLDGPEAVQAVKLDAPVRAQDAALVPISVELAAGLPVAALWVLVDGNPSPRAGTFRFGEAADPRLLRMRVRVDQYTLLHAVAELRDGRLLAVERYVKASGGCSAPSLKDAALAMSRMGQMRLRLLRDPAAAVVAAGGAPPSDGESLVANLLVSHPNNNGMQVEQLSGRFIPARYVQDLSVRQGGRTVFDLEADISLSEDPALTFAFHPQGTGPVEVEMQDSTGAKFRQSFALATSDGAA